jgi:hypothetical protein
MGYVGKRDWNKLNRSEGRTQGFEKIKWKTWKIGQFLSDADIGTRVAQQSEGRVMLKFKGAMERGSTGRNGKVFDVAVRVHSWCVLILCGDSGCLSGDAECLHFSSRSAVQGPNHPSMLEYLLLSTLR